MARSWLGKVALITGASSGIGAALGRELARRGARPVLAARRLDRVEALTREIQEAGGRALAVQCDVTRDEDVERAAREAREALGSIDVVVANAGFGIMGRVEDLTLDEVRRQFETNVFGVLRTVQATLPDLKRARGSFAVMGSVSGYLSTPAASAYAMSKAAVRALADSMRAEVRRDGVAVLHVAPGFVESEIRAVDSHGVFDATRKDPVPGWLQMPATAAARQIADAIEARQDELVLTVHGKVAASLARHAPGVVSTVMGLSARLGRSR